MVLEWNRSTFFSTVVDKRLCKCQRFSKQVKVIFRMLCCWLFCLTCLEAFTMNDGWARLVVFLFGNPHLLECRQWSQDGSTDPDRVLPFWWGDDLDFHCRWSQSGNFLLHSVSNSRVHGSTSREDRVGVKVLPNIDIAFHDAVVRGLMNATRIHSQ